MISSEATIISCSAGCRSCLTSTGAGVSYSHSHDVQDRHAQPDHVEEREEGELTSPAKETEPEPPLEPLCADGSLPSCPGEPADRPPLLPGASVIPLESEQASQDDRDAEDPTDGKGGDA